MMEFQRPILQKIFGVDVKIDHQTGDKSYINAQSLVQYIKDNKYDEVVMVAPLSVMTKVIELGIKPIKADVVEVKSGEDFTFEYNKRFYKFIKFVRVIRLELVTEDL